VKSVHDLQRSRFERHMRTVTRNASPAKLR
jgi:hypothetical protein